MRSWSTNTTRQLLDVADSRLRPHSQRTPDRRQAARHLHRLPNPHVALPRPHSREGTGAIDE